MEFLNFDKNQVLFRKNKKTGEIERVKIVDILYKLDKSVNQSYNHNKESLIDLIDKKVLSTNINEVKLEAIKKLEEQFNIKLKEV